MGDGSGTSGQVDIGELKALLARQRDAVLSQEPPSVKRRKDWLNRAIALLVDNKQAFSDAMSADFGHRSCEQSLVTDIYASVASLKFARDNVARWMRPERRTPLFPLGFVGARAEVHTQPKGVVGLISPWNFPVNLTFCPMASIFAAGNRVMIKPSELTPETSALMARLIHEAYDADEAVVVEGGPEVAQAFSGLAFDHLMFTGSTAVGRHVMRAAAENLVPVTLELGGKCPVVIGKGANIAVAAERIVQGKMINSGQVCLAPDYILVDSAHLEDLVSKIEASVAAQYPTLKDNDDYTSVQNERHFERLVAHLEDAAAKGARIIEVNPTDESFVDQSHRKMPLMLVIDPSAEMSVMQEELFGPILPIIPVSSVEDAISFINAHDRPLALYYFGPDAKERDYVLARTASGGVSVNETLMHFSMEDLPFGGIGPSGMGHYHGQDGYREFSHARAVFVQGWYDASSLFRAPYGSKIRSFMRLMMRK